MVILRRNAIESVFKAIDKYNPVHYGYKYDFESAPKFNYGASTDMGLKWLCPLKEYNKTAFIKSINLGTSVS